MFCCFRKDDRIFTMNAPVEAKIFGGRTIPEPLRWTGLLESERGQFKSWISREGTQLVEIEADRVATNCHEGDGGIWADLPPGLCLAAVVLGLQHTPEGEPYRPVKIFTRPALELESYLKNDRYPLVGRLAGELVFKRAPTDFILRRN